MLMTCCFLLSNRSFRIHGIQNPLGIAGQSPHGMDGIGANPQNIQSALGVDGTMDGTMDGTTGTGVLRLQRSQRITLSTLGWEVHGEKKVRPNGWNEDAWGNNDAWAGNGWWGWGDKLTPPPTALPSKGQLHLRQWLQQLLPLKSRQKLPQHQLLRHQQRLRLPSQQQLRQPHLQHLKMRLPSPAVVLHLSQAVSVRAFI